MAQVNFLELKLRRISCTYICITSAVEFDDKFWIVSCAWLHGIYIAADLLYLLVGTVKRCIDMLVDPMTYTPFLGKNHDLYT
jgi:hypothetical protein